MRALVVGLGSMGKRRIRNLTRLGAGPIAGMDPRADRRDEVTRAHGVTVFETFDAAVQRFEPELVVISTPPDRHVAYAIEAMRRGLHCFMEASVVDDRLDELIALSEAHPHVVVAPSCTLRYHPAVRAMRDLLDPSFGAPLVFTYHSGQWLPDWHPWEDYRRFYVSRRETGACREIVPFELSWLTWVFGPIERLTAMRGKLSRLDADIDDAYQLLLKFDSGLLGHLLVDVIARSPVRLFRVCSDRATIEWNAVDRKLATYRADTREWEVVPEPTPIQEPDYVYAENMYIDEMADLLAACRGEREWSYTLRDDARSLRALRAAERAADERTHVDLD